MITRICDGCGTTLGYGKPSAQIESSVCYDSNYADLQQPDAIKQVNKVHRDYCEECVQRFWSALVWALTRCDAVKEQINKLCESQTEKGETTDSEVKPSEVK